MATQRSILVIDDDQNVRCVIESILSQEDYVVHLARDGREGWRAFFNLRPDLVILDIKMPRMNGWEVCKRIREVSGIPILC